MNKTPITGTLVALAAVLSSFQAVADCEQVLNVTGRNYLLKQNVRDIQATFYKDACRSGDTDASANYKDLQRTFGFSYSNKDEFCKAEAGNYDNYSFDYLSTSTVVESALRVYKQCKVLEKSRITVEVNSGNERFSVDISRGAPTSGILNGWQTAETVKCSLVGFGRKIDDTSVILNLGLSLPTDSKISLSCIRAGQSSPGNSGTFFPENNLIVFTSEGSINLLLPSALRSGDVWASEIELKLKAANKQLTEMSSQISELQKSKLSGVEFRVGPSSGSSASGPILSSDCPTGTVVTGLDIQAGGVPNHRVRCVSLGVDRK